MNGLFETDALYKSFKVVGGCVVIKVEENHTVCIERGETGNLMCTMQYAHRDFGITVVLDQVTIEKVDGAAYCAICAADGQPTHVIPLDKKIYTAIRTMPVHT